MLPNSLGPRVAFVLGVVLALLSGSPSVRAETPHNFKRENLVPWCIVPFDAKKRGPAERAEMLIDLGLKRCAYDWRAEHVPTFEEEILQYKNHGIEFFAFWAVHDEAFRLFQKHHLHPQIWQTLGDGKGETHEQKVKSAADAMAPLARRAQEIECKLGLYNHGGWGGEPKNLVAVCKELHERGLKNVGIVYNFHHGHNHIDDWAESLALTQPHLLCLNLNGMNRGAQPKILGIGKGEHEVSMIREIIKSGYDGPIGIIDHREQLDARESLQENLDGLAWVLKEIEKPGSGGPKPKSQASAEADMHGKSQAANSLGHSHHKNHTAHSATRHASTPSGSGVEPPYDANLVDRLAAEAPQRGDALRGAAVFAAARSACLSCHRVGEHGGTVGPELTTIGKQRDLNHLIESLFWPKREVKPEYKIWQFLTADGESLSGFLTAEDDTKVVIRELATGKARDLPRDGIEARRSGSTPMPDGLVAALSRQQQLDLIRFLSELGTSSVERITAFDKTLAEAQAHGPATFPIVKKPFEPQAWTNSGHSVNRERIYDFYTKQAEHFRTHSPGAHLLMDFPGLDGPNAGHWGLQNEQSWSDDRWNKTDLGTLLAGVFRADKRTVPRGVCVRLGEQGEVSACFNPDTLTYDAVWSGDFLQFSAVRHGFMDAVRPAGPLQATPAGKKPEEPFQYHGFYRYGRRVVFAYRIGDVEYLDAPWVDEGKFTREVAPRENHSLKNAVLGGERQWPESIETDIRPGAGRPYAIDTIELPWNNPWKALLFCSGHDFLPDGSALVCTMQGDVWRVEGLNGPEEQAGKVRWTRFAAGLHQPLGLLVDGDSIFVQCRDQLTRLREINGDGEADFYECFSNAFETSPAGHDYICGLERDRNGNFYTVSGNQGLVRISSDGKRADVLATGLRNPDGLGLYPDGVVTVPCSEGEWTPASMICAVRPPTLQSDAASSQTPHFGYRGPKNNQPPELPLAYLPRGLDNSSGGQTLVSSNRWGPLQGQMIHLSFGACSHFLVLREEIDGQLQGAVVPLAGDFLSGVHRGRFNPQDGQLYVTGMNGWGSYASQDGCFQRIRYTGDRVQLPVGFHVHENGLRIQFSEPIDAKTAEDVRNHFAQCWNYRYSAAYGSPELSTSHPGVRGHDRVTIAAAHVLEEGKTLFLELPDLQPVNQLHLRLRLAANETSELFVTVHKLGPPFETFSGYTHRPKVIASHPLLVDMALNARRTPNPWSKAVHGAREITIETGKNLTFATTELRVRAGEPLKLTLSNPDVVPHNWALVRPGQLEAIGNEANRLITDPEALARHYIPRSESVLAYTDIVPPGERFTIHFHAPKQPGRYPFLCTFPGHWQVMNGTLIVE